MFNIWKSVNLRLVSALKYLKFPSPHSHTEKTPTTSLMWEGLYRDKYNVDKAVSEHYGAEKAI